MDNDDHLHLDLELIKEKHNILKIQLKNEIVDGLKNINCDKIFSKLEKK